ncbi:hypothetical protein TgHK011_001337 [Trichoderma gracile]|nr:hypothetical protein TgHK011_001337 [Trichoderma gracile]
MMKAKQVTIAVLSIFISDDKTSHSCFGHALPPCTVSFLLVFDGSHSDCPCLLAERQSSNIDECHCFASYSTIPTPNKHRF